MAETLRRPPGRYDEPRHPSWLLPLLGGTLAGSLVLVLFWTWSNASDRRTASTLKGFEVVSDEVVEIRFEVHKAPSSSVTCLLRALGEDKAVVGSEQVVVGPSDAGPVRVTHRLTTSARAVAGEVARCRP